MLYRSWGGRVGRHISNGKLYRGYDTCGKDATTATTATPNTGQRDVTRIYPSAKDSGKGCIVRVCFYNSSESLALVSVTVCGQRFTLSQKAGIVYTYIGVYIKLIARGGRPDI